MNNNTMETELAITDFYLQVKSIISMNDSNRKKHAILDKIFCRSMHKINRIYLK